MSKEIKKNDLIIIGIVILVVLVLSIVFFKSYFTKKQSNVEIIFDNEIIDIVSIDKNVIYEFKYNETNQMIEIFKNDKLFASIHSNKNIYNKIVIKDRTVIMEEASCPHKDCMKMKLSGNLAFPIICTNGIVIRSTDEKTEILV